VKLSVLPLQIPRNLEISLSCISSLTAKPPVSLSFGSFGMGSHHEWLQATDPICDKLRIEEQKGYDMKKNQGWCKWIFANETFKTWRHNEDSRLLWIHGNAGAGKTMLLASIIDELETRNADGRKTSTVSYCFCENPPNSAKIQDATSVFRGLISILFEREPALSQRPDYRACQPESYQYKSDDAVRALSEQLKKMILILEHPVYFIIDAYDEFEKMEQWKNLLVAVGRSFDYPNVRWLVSTRQDCKEVKTWYHGLKKSRAGRVLEINLSSHALAPTFDQFIDEELARLSWLDADLELRQDLKKAIHEKAQLRFFWVSYICERLQGVEGRDPLKEVENAPEHLSDTLTVSKSAASVRNRYEETDLYATAGYEKYHAFKQKVRMIRAGEIGKSQKDKEGSTYDLLTDAIAKHKKAIQKAKEAHPHYHSAIIRAEIGIAESYRELSFSKAYRFEKQLDCIRLAKEHIASAITRSREYGYTAREQRAKYEKLVLKARGLIIRERWGLHVRNKEVHISLLGQAYECRMRLTEALNKTSNDTKTTEWTQRWLNELDPVIRRLEDELS